MTQTHRYRILGVMLVAVSVLFINSTVYAATCSNEEKETLLDEMEDKCTKRNLSSYYSIKLQPTTAPKTSDGKVTYYIHSANLNIEGTHKFEIVRILAGGHGFETTDGTSTGILKNPIKFTSKKGVNISVKPGTDGEVSVRVKLVYAKGGTYENCLGTSNQYKKYANKDQIKKCNYSGTFKVDLSTISGDPDYDDFEYSQEIQEQADSFLKNIKNNLQDTTRYKEWSAIYNHSGVIEKQVENDEVNVGEIQCDYKNRSMTEVEGHDDPKDPTDDPYYPNKKYYRTSHKTDPVQAVYKYNYTSGKTVTTKDNVCSPICKEAVRVEYGPPVASKAGLCFEYKVKVTSYVVCEPGVIKELPQTKYNVCTPAPYCENGLPRYSRQAGPNEEYESCINECDGGKYTRSCSDKCYKKVYGNKKSDNKQLSNAVANASLTNLANDDEEYKCDEPDGCYTYDLNGHITWKTKFSQAAISQNYLLGYGRWYRDNNYQVKEARTSAEYLPDKMGIPRAHYITGTDCDDVCYWTGCSKKTYLNESEARKDMDANFESWKAAVTACAAKAKCTTTTAEYTIKTDYTTKKGEQMEIDFPYSATPVKKHDDKITPQELKSLGTEDGKCGGQTAKNEPENEGQNIILNYDGCYKKCNNKNWYMTEWSYPGTWVNNKSGAISYINKAGNDAWHLDKNKFCTPLNIKTVNNSWWVWKLVDDCPTEKNYYKNINEPDFNITAQTKKFGYFKWNIDIKCFYAVRNETVNEKGNDDCKSTTLPKCNSKSGDCPENETNSVNNYEFRIIDSNNMFPDREPGFNYSADAAATVDKEPINPSGFVQSIQERQEDTYSDKYLDYYFELDKIDLAEIRSFTKTEKGNNYNSFPGNISNKSEQRAIYESPLIEKLAKKVNDSTRYKVYGRDY
ncbi:MAG: hypothetical protein E7160_01380 [Firmicutes bacterium]|nr:hypothetical protein [Bacillota bacterium]